MKLFTEAAKMLEQNSYEGLRHIALQAEQLLNNTEDEEAVNLVKYQNGYNLASKMIQTLTEIYDRLILETGV